MREKLPVRTTYSRIRRYERPVSSDGIDLSDNTNLWGPPPEALEALKTLGATNLGRYPTVYGDGLVEALARHHDVAPECIVTGCGSDDVLDSAMRALLKPGQTVLCHRPTFSTVPQFALMNELEVVEVAEGDIPTVAPDLVYLCRPNNPTGTCLPGSELLAWLKHEGRPWVFVDEAYADFARTTVADKLTSYPQLVILRTFSKLYGLAGLRVGYALANPAVAREIEKSRGPFKVNALAENIAERALAASSEWTQQVVADVERNRGRLTLELRERGFTVRESSANFVLIDLPEDQDAKDVASKLKDRGVLVRPISWDTNQALRVTIGPWEMMAKFLEAIESKDKGPRDTSPRIAVLDYGTGNVRSLEKALQAVGSRAEIVTSLGQLGHYDGLVLPGVGSFTAITRFFEQNPIERETLQRWIQQGRPFLGVCLGMQFLFERSEESPGLGLGWFTGQVTRLEGNPVPHIGWSDVEAQASPAGGADPSGWTDSKNGDGNQVGTFYFAHSYGIDVDSQRNIANPGIVATTSVGGRRWAAVVRRRNVVGTQFHPEKSGAAGLNFLRGFVTEVSEASAQSSTGPEETPAFAVNNAGETKP